MDILIDKNGELMTENGDFAVGESTLQDVGQILVSVQGEWKESPQTGLNIFRHINRKVNRSEFEKNVRLQMELDGKNYDEIKREVKFNMLKL